MAQSARDAALRLSWRRCGDHGHRCSFFDLKLDGDSLAEGGAYVIWAEDADGNRKKAVYVGQGKPVADCLARHREEGAITRHQRSERGLLPGAVSRPLFRRGYSSRGETAAQPTTSSPL